MFRIKEVNVGERKQICEKGKEKEGRSKQGFSNQIFILICIQVTCSVCLKNRCLCPAYRDDDSIYLRANPGIWVRLGQPFKKYWTRESTEVENDTWWGLEVCQ